MATPLTRNPKFDWSKYDIKELKKEYYEIGLSDFMKRYKVGRGPVFTHLGYIPDELKKAITARKFAGIPRNRLKSKIERFENTTKVAKMYENKMNQLESPEYTGPFAKYINKF